MRRNRIGAVAVAIGMGVGLLALQPGANSATRPAAAAPHHITAFAWIKVENSKGKVVFKHRYPASSAGKTMKLPPKAMRTLRGPAKFTVAPSVTGTEGSSTASGTATIGVGQVDESDVGNTLWHFTTTLQFSWNRANEAVNMIGHAVKPWQDLSQVWSWDGLVGQNHRVFVWNSTNLLGHSGYHSMYQGEYTGPNRLLMHDVHEYPHNVLEAHYNGTWYWQHTCCGAPS